MGDAVGSLSGRVGVLVLSLPDKNTPACPDDNTLSWGVGVIKGRVVAAWNICVAYVSSMLLKVVQAQMHRCLSWLPLVSVSSQSSRAANWRPNARYDNAAHPLLSLGDNNFCWTTLVLTRPCAACPVCMPLPFCALFSPCR